MTNTGGANGTAPNARTVILHLDDVGMCHGANVAYLELFAAGAITSGSVMVPCPWFPEISAAARADRSLDLGVHLTLTSEWDNYRWRAISTTQRSSGLVDDDGYLPKNCLKLRAHLVPEACEIEFRAQINHALASGIDATHLDTHMGAALLPELLPIYLKLGREYRLPLLLPRDLASYFDALRLGAIDNDPYREALVSLEHDGAIIVDHFRMTPGVASAEAEVAYEALLTTVPSGLTFVALHCNAPGDIDTIVPSRAHWRTDEFRLFGDGSTSRWLTAAGVSTIGYAGLRGRLRASSLRST